MQPAKALHIFMKPEEFITVFATGRYHVPHIYGPHTYILDTF
jgi:hypothetical protein